MKSKALVIIDMLIDSASSNEILSFIDVILVITKYSL